ncbi:MAG: F0F1 ATP synthase subunit alpha [Rhodospirillaceae bacterium]|nr:F0F1 ATP synthase subunit alpha [Rhodospirillaceae bacterium]
MNKLRRRINKRLDTAQRKAKAVSLSPRQREAGIVESVGDGVATLSGLSKTRLGELLIFAGDIPATAVDLRPDNIGTVLLGSDEGIAAGQEVRGTGEILRVPVGEALLGRIVDPLGNPLDNGPPIKAEQLDPIERPGPDVIDRDLVNEPLHTGVTVIDAMIPIGRGQRELIMGDRGTGRTSLAIDAIINQRNSDVVCIYAAVGQKAATVNAMIDRVRRNGPFERSIFVVAEADSAPGLQWIAPYTACTMAEYFRDRGRHALLVIDDLSKHAIIHRQLSLLLHAPPGREAYPGDVFHIHARLLERAAKLSPAHGGGSLTALPIAETQAGNISAYIPTNLISITDGQIFLETKLFNEGQKPAVNVGKSVSRIGGKTQADAVRHASESLKLDYAQFLELEVFTRFGQVVDERASKIIEHGRRIRAILCQPLSQPLSVPVQLALLLALQEGILGEVPLDKLDDFKAGLQDAMDVECAALLERLRITGRLDGGDRSLFIDWLRGYARPLSPAEGGG